MVAGCANSPNTLAAHEKSPVQIGGTQYKDQIIPVFDGLTVKYERLVPLHYPFDPNLGIEGEGVVMVIVDENGIPLEFGIMSSTPVPEFALATLAAAKKWRYFPMKDATGKAFVHGLRISMKFTVDTSYSVEYKSIGSRTSR